MILTGSKIKEEVLSKRITIDPYHPSHLNPNSYDFHLGSSLLTYENEVLDPKKEMQIKEEVIPKEGYLLEPGQLYLGSIKEYIGSDYYVPIIKGISSIARLGLFIVITADLVDQGAFGNWTLMLHPVKKLRVYKDMKIGQMTFWEVSGEPDLYSGKYQDSRHPQKSKSYLDIGYLA